MSFLNFLTKNYKNKLDIIIFIDKNQCWYHKGIDSITNNIDETVEYLKKKIYTRNEIDSKLYKKYKKIIFMGVSAGGYASILFGSLCNIDNVISFIPRTKLINPIDKKYEDLNNFINKDVNYLLIGDLSEKNKNSNHYISQCTRLDKYNNIYINKFDNLNLKKLRDNGTLNNLIDNILNN